MISQEVAQKIADQIADSGCPARVVDRLEAFKAGIIKTMNFVMTNCSLDEVKEQNIIPLHDEGKID